MKKCVWAYLACVLLLGVFFLQTAGNLVAQSPVVDEPSHIARAMAYWRVGDLRLQLGHPPLIHALAGLPLLLEPTAPNVSTLEGWQEPFDRGTLNRHALYDPERATDRIVFLSRWPVLMLAMLLGALIFRWAGERFGVRAALAVQSARYLPALSGAGRARSEATPGRAETIRARLEAPATDSDGDPITYRYRWEWGYAAIALTELAGFAALVLAVLADTPRNLR